MHQEEERSEMVDMLSDLLEARTSLDAATAEEYVTCHVTCHNDCIQTLLSKCMGLSDSDQTRAMDKRAIQTKKNAVGAKVLFVSWPVRVTL